MNEENRRVLLGMSGGVDSSAAALVLQREGWEVTGVTMRLHKKEPSVQEGGCCTSDDVEDAKNVANKLGIPHHIFNFTELFEEKVINYFVRDYLNGRTPNPCVACNRYIKFDAMLRRAESLGIGHIATGHYARIRFDADRNRWLLLRSQSAKDQSYVLYNLTQEQLSRTLFPLADLPKAETRALAEQAGLCVAKKSDSQEICFIPDNDYAGFIQRRVGQLPPPGNFVDVDGNVIGKHRGIVHYTIGQRKGLGVTFGQPMFVCGINAQENTVTLGVNGSQTAKALEADDLNLISVPALEAPMQVQAKPRYQAKAANALLSPASGGAVRVEFEEPQRSLTPGQAVVFYDGDIVIGGATIRRVLK